MEALKLWIHQYFCHHRWEAWNIWSGPAAYRCWKCGEVDWIEDNNENLDRPI